jgi:Mn2+/Fe2+ NRAMP family transporter
MKRDLLGIINCLGPNHSAEPSFYDLFVFGIGAVFLCFTLIFLFNYIPAKNNKEEVEKIKLPIVISAIPFVIGVIFVSNSVENLFRYSELLIILSLVYLVYYLNYFESRNNVKKRYIKYSLKDNIICEPIFQNYNLQIKNRISDLSRFTIIVLVVITIFTPLYKLLGTGYFL